MRPAIRHARWLGATLAAGAALSSQSASAADCPVQHDRLLAALKASLRASGGPANGGFETHEWAAVVSRDGVVCAIAFSGAEWDDQWPASRAIAAAKANTANALSVDKMALSTANLYAGALPGGPLYGAFETSPADSDDVPGDPAQFGTPQDPMIGKALGVESDQVVPARA